MAKGKFDMSEFLTPVESVPESDTREQIEYIDEAKLSGDGENFYSMEGIEALAQNIELVGLQQPLRVRPDPDDEGGYIVVSGHRRLTAIRTICKADEPKRWRTVPCIVERGELSPAMRELRLIYANSDTRRMSNADLGAQAERVEKLLYQLKEEGVEFPGRMRDHVAEVCQISKSKLARLKVIREGLSKSEQIAKAWEKGELPEATAYELAHMPEKQQDEIAYAYTHRKTYYGHGLTYLSTDKVKNIGATLEALGNLPCTHGGRCADVAQGKRANILKKLTESAWSFVPCGSTCCADCSELGTCKQVCPLLLAKQDAMKTKKRADQRAERERQAEAERPVIGEIAELWRRFGAARAAAGKSAAECYNAAGVVYGVPDADEVTRLENGEAKYAVNTKLPYGYNCYLDDIHCFTRVADLLGVSLDYLCGLTDDPAPTKVMSVQDGPVQASKTREKTESKKERNEELLALRWYESDVEPPNGAHIVFIEESGIVDDDEYINGRLKSGYTDWDEVLLWTIHPDDSSPDKTVSSPGWSPLDAEHWPEEGALVVLSYPTGLGGSAYLTARCGGGANDQYPFVSTDAGISVQDIVECKCDSWLLISERQRGEK